MTVRVFLRISDPFGVPLTTVAGFFVLDYIMNCSPGAVGTLELTASPGLNSDFLFRDGRIQVFRSIDGGIPYCDNNAVYLIDTFEYTAASTFIRAFHANGIVGRRYVTYANGSTYANKTATYADNLIKAYWRENAGSLIGGSREGTQTQADLSSYITVEPDLSLGPSIAMQAAHDPLDSVLQRICDASSTAGTYLTYEILWNGNRGLYFRTYTTVRGIDRRYGSSANPVILSESRANLENAKLSVDYHNEVTAAIAGGIGTGTDRIIATALDTTRIALSPFGRIERFTENGNGNSAAVVQATANALLRESRPVISMGGTLIDTRSTTRGIHYDLGDLLTVEVPRTKDLIDVRLDLIHEHYDASNSSSGQDLTSHQVAHRYANAGLRSV
jgi:hypothetical protein